MYIDKTSFCVTFIKLDVLCNSFHLSRVILSADVCHLVKQTKMIHEHMAHMQMINPLMKWN